MLLRLPGPGGTALMRRRLAAGLGAGLADRLVIAAVQLALVPLLASHWGVERYGSWVLLLSLPALLALGDLGHGGAAVVRVTIEVARGDYPAARATLHSATQVIVIAGAGLIGMALAAAVLVPTGWLPVLPALPPSALRLTIVLLTTHACVVLTGSLFTAMLRSHGQFARDVALGTATFLMEQGLLIATVVAGGGLVDAAVALLGGRLLGTAATAIAAWRCCPALRPGLSNATAAVLRELLRPALAVLAIPLGTTLLLQGTVIALGLVAGAAAVPVLVAARTLSRLALQLTQVLTGPLQPEFGAACARGDRPAMARMVRTVLCGAALIGMPAAAVLALAGPALIALWSGQLLIAPPWLMVAMAISALAGAVWKPQSDLMLAAGRQGEFALRYGVIALAAVGLTLLTGAWLGSIAAALAMALADLAMIVVVWRFVRPHLARRVS